MYPLILSLSDKMQSIYPEKANLNKQKERLTPDKSSQDGCIMLGVFYCSEKGHAIRQDSLQGFPNGRRRQSARGAGTKCCLQKRGYRPWLMPEGSSESPRKSKAPARPRRKNSTFLRVQSPPLWTMKHGEPYRRYGKPCAAPLSGRTPPTA